MTWLEPWARGKSGWLGGDFGVETPPLSSPACTVGALQKMEAEFLFLPLDGRNVTTAALSTLGVELGFDGEAAQPAKLPAAEGVGMSWLASRPGTVSFFIKVSSHLTACHSSTPGSPPLSQVLAGPTSLKFFFLFGRRHLFRPLCLTISGMARRAD